MLKRLALTNWKSFGTSHGAFPLAPLTVLVGPNASGKSNALDALRLLQGIALDLPLEDVLRGRSEGGREVWPGLRGGASEAVRRPATKFSIESEWDLLTHKVSVSIDPLPAIERESLRHGADVYFDTHAARLQGRTGRQPGGGLSVAVRSAKKGSLFTRLYKDSLSVLAQFRPEDVFAPAAVGAVLNHRNMLRELLFLDIQPRSMRGPSQLGRSLGLSGEHIAAVVHNLSPAVKQDVVDWLSELCAPMVKGLVTEVVPGVQEVYLFMEELGGTRISARSLSDGTLRFLGTLVALLTAPQGSVVLLEEPDVGLHPARIHLLAEFLESVTRNRLIQVIATSHSPVLLAHLSAEAFGSTIAFDRRPDGSSMVHRVGDLPNVDELMRPENRIRLISTGWLERAA